jgi:PAS domain S-box-containing protein
MKDERGHGGPQAHHAAAAAVSPQFLGAIIDHVAHPIFVKDREFRFVFLNEAFCTMVGWPCEKMLGKTDYDFFPKNEADFFRQKDEEMFARGERVVIDEEPISDAEGRRHWLATTKVPYRAEGGEVTHLVGIIHDVTRLKAAEDALRTSNEELERRVAERSRELAAAQGELLRKERLAVLGQLAGGVAHQIRNPLAIIKNASYVLERAIGPTDDATIIGSLAMIHDEITHADGIVTDLLDYAAVRPPRLRSVAISEVIDLAVRSDRIPATVRLIVQVAPLAPIMVDEQQLHGALGNLIRNACEAMTEGGTLTVGARDDGDSVLIFVEDTGPGIAPEVCDRLFEPLVTTKPLGLGLGLVTARTLVGNHGGTITAGKGARGGARFEIRLPRNVG